MRTEDGRLWRVWARGPDRGGRTRGSGRDRTLLGQYRARLAANRHTAPLFDMARFTRALDDLLLAAWENRPSPPHT